SVVSAREPWPIAAAASAAGAAGAGADGFERSMPGALARGDQTRTRGAPTQGSSEYTVRPSRVEHSKTAAGASEGAAAAPSGSSAVTTAATAASGTARAFIGPPGRNASCRILPDIPVADNRGTTKVPALALERNPARRRRRARRAV